MTAQPPKRSRSRARPGAIDLARAQYVEGEASVRRIAEELGIPRRTLERVAGEEGWSARREAFRAEAAERRRSARLEEEERQAKETARLVAETHRNAVRALEARVRVVMAQTGKIAQHVVRNEDPDPRLLISGADVRQLVAAIADLDTLAVVGADTTGGAATMQQALRWFVMLEKVHGKEAARMILEDGAKRVAEQEGASGEA